MIVALDSWILKLSRVFVSTTLPGSWLQRCMACGKNNVLYTVVLVWVEAVQRRAARSATGDYQRTSSVTATLQQLHWQTLQSRRAYAQTVMMYRIVYNLVDIPAEHHLNRTSLRTRGHSLRFLVPHTRTTVYRTSFFPQAIRLWYQLPGSVVEVDILDSFKAQLFRATLI
jgi:hypothetical protein